MPRGGARPGAGRPRKLGAELLEQHRAPVARPSLRELLESPTLNSGGTSAGTVPAPPGGSPPALPPSPQSPTTAAPAVADAPKSVFVGDGWVKWVTAFAGRKATQYWADSMDASGLEARPYDEENMANAQAATEESVRMFAPDLRLPWWIGLPLAWLFVYLDMRVGAQKKGEAAAAAAAPSTSSPPAAAAAAPPKQPDQPAKPDAYKPPTGSGFAALR